MEAHDAPHILSVPPHSFAENWLGLSITNTVISTWIFIIIVIICWVLLRQASKKDGGFIRTTGYIIVKKLKAFFEPMLGHNLPTRKTLWFVGGIFLYILWANLYSLLLDWILAFSPTSWHEFLRPINSDINTTLGMAIIMIVISHILMIRFHGFFGYILHFIFNFSGKSFVDKFINVIVGWIHLVGEGVRVLSLSLRLFGNIFAWAVLIGVMLWITAKIGIFHLPVGNLLMVPFYFFEMFVGFIQAMVFSLLVALYFQEASDTHSHH